MKLPLLSIIPSVLVMLTLHSPSAQAAGFDCAKATTQVERTICGTPVLSALDEQLNEQYKGLKHLQVFRLMETQWLSDVRNECETVSCLEDAYRTQQRLLSPATLVAPVDQTTLKPLPPGQRYSMTEDEPWDRYTLASFEGVRAGGDQQIVDAAVISGVLHVVLFVGKYRPDEPGYVGNLYEYVDNKPGLHIIASEVAFVGWAAPARNDQGMRFAGISDGVFYYRQHQAGNLQKGMAYRIASRQAPKESTQVFQVPSNTLLNAKANVTEDVNTLNNQLTLNYPVAAFGTYAERVADPDAPGIPDTGWGIVNPTWSETRPVLYFDNNGARACIWRVDLATKTLSKIVPEHEAVSGHSIEFNGREALVYLDGNALKFAMAPD
ncbi:hypothetical protein [Pseudomonas purpurea]|uniref:lysozyme inhibitor LprI family protein n=1 Tax=Pseudomonas purpurea TaxID=3136737 RepID=UPI003265CB32